MDCVQKAAQAKAVGERLSRELGLQETCRRVMKGIPASATNCQAGQLLSHSPQYHADGQKSWGVFRIKCNKINGVKIRGVPLGVAKRQLKRNLSGMRVRVLDSWSTPQLQSRHNPASWQAQQGWQSPCADHAPD